MDFSASAATKDAARLRRRRFCTPPRFFSTLPNRPGQWFVVRPLLQRRHLRVFFAGEHLSEACQGFMEGAVETGEAARTN
jgi:monoamine oxidase